MNLLVVCNLVKPSKYNGSVQMITVSMIRGLYKLNHDVSIIALIDDIQDAEDIDNAIDSYWSVIKYIPLNYKMKSNLSDYIISTADSFVPNYYKCPKDIIEKEYDAVIAICGLSACLNVANNLFKTNKIHKYIQVYTDPIALKNYNRSFKSNISNIYRIILSKKFLKTCNYAYYLGDPMANYQKSLMVKYKNIIDSYCGVYSDLYPEDYSKQFNYNLGYFGSFDPKIRDIKPLIEAMRFLPEFKLSIFGNGNLEAIPPKNVFLSNERSPHSEIIKKELESDIYICIMNHSNYSLPGKLFYLAATKIPILVIIDKSQIDLKKYLEKFDRYIIVNNDPLEIVEAVRKTSNVNVNNSIAKHVMSPEFVMNKIVSRL